MRYIEGLQDDDFPRTPEGDELTEEYWLGIESAVNKCGDRFLEIWRDYKHDSVLNLPKLHKCADELDMCRAKFGTIPFAINVVIFNDGLQASEDKSVFHWNIVNTYTTMPNNIYITVERLRFINSKWIEKKNSIASQLRGDNLGITKI